MPQAAGASPRGRMVPGTATLALVLEERKIHWRAVDWACAHSRQAGQRSLQVMLIGRPAHLVELDNLADGAAEAAWHALSEDLHDAVTEHIWGWGLEPVIHRLEGRAVFRAITRWAVRPDLLVAGRPGRLSWLSRQLVRRLQHRELPIVLVT